MHHVRDVSKVAAPSTMPAAMNRPAAAVAIFFAFALPTQQPVDPAPLVDRLREIANRETLNKDAAAQRAADAAAWLEATAGSELGDLAILRTIAGSCTADIAIQGRSTAELVTWFEQHERLPVAGFEEPAGRVVLFDFVRRADAGKWDECKASLPLLLRTCSDHRSAFWLLGRRARDAGTPSGNDFLQQVLIPHLLADHGLDDAERVQTLRRLYEVEYTGPKPFTDVAGPGLDGKQIRTADHLGRVLLVDYWATWCQPCLMALPGVVAAHRRFHDQGLDVVGISIDDAPQRDRVAAKVEELGIGFPVIFDGKGGKSEIALANKVLAIPATFLIDRKGRVRYTGLQGEQLTARIAELLAEK